MFRSKEVVAINLSSFLMSHLNKKNEENAFDLQEIAIFKKLNLPPLNNIITPHFNCLPPRKTMSSARLGNGDTRNKMLRI